MMRPIPSPALVLGLSCIFLSRSVLAATKKTSVVKKIAGGVLAAIVVAVIVGILILILICWCCMRHRRKNQPQAIAPPSKLEQGGQQFPLSGNFGAPSPYPPVNQGGYPAQYHPVQTTDSPNLGMPQPQEYGSQPPNSGYNNNNAYPPPSGPPQADYYVGGPVR